MMRLLPAALALLLPFAAAATSLRLPLTECNLSGGCYITAYYDLNRTSGTTRDWNCAHKTYDQHSGTDFGIGGFAGMDANGSRPIVAPADGTVIARADGLYDRNTSATGANCESSVSCGNYVKLQHPDGKVTLHCHMKRGSVAVSNGASVRCGDIIGRVGSSGCSTGPHLHLGVYVSGSHDCPYKATSGCGGQVSYWVSQGSYLGLPAATCECTPNCSGKTCGSDGCGGSCGSCAAGTACSGGQCVCTPVCSGKQCGADGCGGSCGSCAAGSVCSGDQCVCAPQCAGRQCGPDGCDGSCGACPEGASCSDGQCVCTPQCEGRECGPDGCGGLCGGCPDGEDCSPEGSCLAPGADAGSGADSGLPGGDGGSRDFAPVVEVTASGCGCHGAPGPAFFGTGLLLLAPWSRRRRRAR